MIKKIEGYTIIAPPMRVSNRLKKYEVYKDDKYITAFGAKDYGHYKDRIGFYTQLNTYDKEKRKRFWERHSKDRGVVENNPKYAGYWAKYLW